MRVDGNVGTASQAITTVVGKSYTVSADLFLGTSASAAIYISTTASSTQSFTSFTQASKSVTFIARSTTTYIVVRVNAATNTYIEVDNISARLAEEDRSSPSTNGIGLQVFGTITKSAVATGADLVAYSGFSASNYLQQPYNSDYLFGEGDFCVSCWAKSGAYSADEGFWSFGVGYDNTGAASILAYRNSSAIYFYTRVHSTGPWVNIGTPWTVNIWNNLVMLRRSGVKELWINGQLKATQDHTGTFTTTGTNFRIGERADGSVNPAATTSMALTRISATAPSPEQIKKIYNDEKHLFQENAKATLYGSSDAVTALAYDDDTELLHAGTSAGRSVFQGLRRIDNTTDAVGAAISASNGMVAED
jgi:hypothetical protein